MEVASFHVWDVLRICMGVTKVLNRCPRFHIFNIQNIDTIDIYIPMEILVTLWTRQTTCVARRLIGPADASKTPT